jgi:hypothetical protein
MNMALRALLFLGCVALLTQAPPAHAEDWASLGGNGQQTRWISTHPSVSPVRLWTSSVTTNSDALGCVLKVGSKVIVVSRTPPATTHRLNAIDTGTGTLSWTGDAYTVGDEKCPAASGSTVVNAEGSSLVARDVGSGAVLWQFSGGGPFVSPAIAGNVVYACQPYPAPDAGWRSRMSAHNLATGSEIWRTTGSCFNNGVGPLVTGSTFVLAETTINREIHNGVGAYIYNQSDGSNIPCADCNADGTGSAAAVDGATIYLVTQGGRRVRSINGPTGSTNWVFTAPDDLVPVNVAVGNSALIVDTRCQGCSSGRIFRLRKADGSVVWSKDVVADGWWPGGGRAPEYLLASDNYVISKQTILTTDTGDVALSCNPYSYQASGGAGAPPPVAFGDGVAYGWAQATAPGSYVLVAESTAGGAANPCNTSNTPEAGGGGGSTGGGADGGNGGGNSGGAPSGCAPPPIGPIGISILDGAIYTNSPRVQLDLIWPACTQHVRISNDGGFKRAQRFGIGASLDWTLVSTGPERLPRTIYVRFGDSSQTFTDDIILDETQPILSEVVASEAASRVGFPNSRGKRFVSVTTKASDKTSGIGRIQVTSSKSKPGKAFRYAKTVRAQISGSEVWVRVQDRAGNFSAWKKASR